MIYKIQNFILTVHNIISDNFGFYLILGVVGLWFSLSMLYSLVIRKNFKNKSILEKILFFPAVAITFLIVIDFVFAGDIPADMTAQETANHFAFSLCNGNFDELIQSKERVFTSKYYSVFVETYGNQNTKEINFVGCNNEHQEVLEYHWQRGKINEENIIRNSPELRHRYKTILQIPKLTEVDEKHYEFCDYFFEIHLRRVVLTSKYLGNYPGWRISEFSYHRGIPYTPKDMIKEMEGIAEAFEKKNLK